MKHRDELVMEKNIFKRILGQEDGFVLVLALLVLVVLSVMGVASIQNSTIELQIAGNERVAAVNLFNAEGSANEAARKVLNEKDNKILLPALNETPASDDLIRTSADDATIQTADKKNLDTNADDKIDTSDNFADASIDAVAEAGTTLKNVVTLNIIPSGSSLGLDTTRVYDYVAYGYAESSGKAIVKLGLKKRF